jgi:hypothetical protein
MEAAGRELERGPRCHTDQAPIRIDLIEQRQQVELVGAASMHQYQRTLGPAAGRTLLVLEKIEVSHGSLGAEP